MNKPFVIGIAGGSGSGKTYFLKSFLRHFKDEHICLISQDDYYHPRESQAKDENGWINFDLPSSIDSNHFISDLQRLINGECVEKKEYTFNNPAVIPKKLFYKPSPIIVIEGLFIYHFEEINKLLDYKIFIDAQEETALKRRLKRDLEERGYPEETVMYQWKNHVMPAYKEFLLPYRNKVDWVVDNSQNIAIELDHLKEMVADRIG